MTQLSSEQVRRNDPGNPKQSTVELAAECVGLSDKIAHELGQAQGQERVVQAIETAGGQTNQPPHNPAEQSTHHKHRGPRDAIGHAEIARTISTYTHRGQRRERLQTGGADDQRPHDVDGCVDTDDSEHREEAIRSNTQRKQEQCE